MIKEMLKSFQDNAWLVHFSIWIMGTAICFIVPFITRYTEIDWKAYMQEVEGPLLHNNYDYETLKGDTGPLVYPAGFVYIFIILRALTDEGLNIFKAQLIFAIIHSLLLGIILMGIYLETQTTPYFALPFVVLSRRAHSIFELRLFNDGIAMLFAYSAIALSIKNFWTLACISFSIGISIKMNVILMAPAFAVLLVQSKGVIGAGIRFILCFLIQVFFAIPFLKTNPWGYLKCSFDLGRVFLLKWTVNYKFLEESIFQSPQLSISLLILTLSFWLIFGHFRWAKSSGGLFKLILNSKMFENRPLSSRHIATCMFESNLIGIVFARSLHYQFYSWYVHSIPFLIWRGSLRNRRPIIGIIVLLGIELCFNIFPSTPLSSFILQTFHVILLVSAWKSPIPSWPHETYSPHED